MKPSQSYMKRRLAMLPVGNLISNSDAGGIDTYTYIFYYDPLAYKSIFNKL